MAAEKIGSETVTYVANIYKYYIAYRLLEDQAAQRDKARLTILGLGSALKVLPSR